VGLPYAKAKLDQLHKRMAPLSGWLDSDGHSEEQNDGGDGEGAGGRRVWEWRRRIMRVMRGVFLAGYPWASAVYEGLFFVYQVLYLYDHTRYYTPLLHLQRLQVQRLSLEDTVYPFPSPFTQSPCDPSPATPLGTRAGADTPTLSSGSAFPCGHVTTTQIEMTQNTARRRAAGTEDWHVDGARGAAVAVRTAGRMLARVWHVVEDYSALALPLILFVFKFLEWWYAENKQTAPALPTPPPPRPPSVRPPPPHPTPPTHHVVGR
jgi:hypothetical protein